MDRVCELTTGEGRFCFSVGSGAPGATLVTAVQALQRAGRTDDGRMYGGGTPGDSGTRTSHVHHQLRPLSPREIRLDGGERAVDANGYEDSG